MIGAMPRRRETPRARTNPAGQKVWVARWTDRAGKRRYGWPPAIPGTYRLKREAQAAIDACYDREASGGDPERRDTVGAYAKTWTDRHPRSERTNRSYDGRVKSVQDVKLEGRPFKDWPLSEVRRRHATDLVDHMLRQQGRAASGAQGVVRVLSAMFQDALSDDLAVANPFLKVTVRASDPRVQKAPRVIQTWSWQQMHALCAASSEAAMLRLLSDCGLRLGELLPLERGDIWDGHLVVSKTAFEGRVLAGTKTDHGKAAAGRRVPLTAECEALLRALPRWTKTTLLFPNGIGKLRSERNFYRDVWYPARKAVPGMGAATPHEFRHSWVSHMLAAGVDQAYVAEIAGHTVTTAMKHYRHVTARDVEAVRAVVGA
jgi:integrase